MAEMENVVRLFQNAINEILATVAGVDDILNDNKKSAMMNAILVRLDQLGVDVDQIVGGELASAYHSGILDADSFMRQEGMDVNVQGIQKQVHLKAVQDIAADTMTDLQAAIRTAGVMFIANVDKILEGVQEEIAKGIILGEGSKKATERIIGHFAKHGMTSFITSDGRRLPLDFYAQTVTRTKYRVAHTTGAVNRYQENGVHHIKINEHNPTCQKCARYQGMVVALSAENADGFPVADEDVPLPPYHPNCRHTARPYVMEYHSQNDINQERKKWNSFDPDKDTRTAAERDLYKTEQAIRRKANQEKRDYMAMKSMMGDEAPKTLAAYRRMKRKGDENWQALQERYKKKQDEVDSASPPKGTPRKRKGSKTGTQQRTKRTETKQTERTSEPAIVTDPPDRRMKLSEADQAAHKEFDKRIDGVELKDRRSVSKQILGRIMNDPYYPGGEIKIGIRKNIGANGYCSSYKIKSRHDQYKRQSVVKDFVLLKDDSRPMQYQWKTLFHEYYHANFSGLTHTDKLGRNTWTVFEETATECSAFFMAQRAGVDISDITPSYSSYLVEMLPRFKQLDEFSDANTIAEFGAKFMKYRFDPDHKRQDWNDHYYDMEDKGIGKMSKQETKAYVDEHYREYIEQNMDEILGKTYDIVSQANKSQIKDRIHFIQEKQIKEGLESGDLAKSAYSMAVAIAMDKLGVKIP